MSALQTAQEYIDRNFLVVPIPAGQKKPEITGWQKLRITREQLARHFNGHKQNIGGLLGHLGLADVDLDCREAVSVASAFLPPTHFVYGRQSNPASHHFYRADPAVKSHKLIDPTNKKATIAELRCLKADGTIGFQSVLPGSVHPTGELIRFEPGCDGHPANVDANELVTAVGRLGAAALLAKHWPDESRHDAGLALCGGLARAGWPKNELVKFWLATYRAVAGHDPAALARCEREATDSYDKNVRGEMTTGFTRLMELVDPRVVEAALKWLGVGHTNTPNAGAQSTGEPTESDTGARSFLGNETGNADRLVDFYGHDLAHCEQRNGYMVWTGRYWKYDKFVMSERMAEATMRRAYADAEKISDPHDRDVFLKFVSKSLSKRGLEAMTHLAKKKVRQVQTTDFDQNPLLLNCQNGAIDLQTGELRQHRKDDLLSKMIPIDYHAGAQCPLFLRFIYRIMGDGPDASKEDRDRASRVVVYLQKLFGCAATGKPEKLLVVFHGASGNNGKTTLLTTISKALGNTEYATQLNIDSLMVDPKGGGTSNAVNSDLSDLQGKRFVFSSEVERGQRLALSRVKYLTGLTSIRARRMRENWIEFPQTWKTFLDCNDRPVITSPTDPVWNRVKCVPFTLELAAKEIDTDLGSKLEAELPGILAWIVVGARDYLAHGLGVAPPEVEASTAEYRESSDRLKNFMEDCCFRNTHAWVSSERLSQAYTEWCGKNGERNPLDGRAFAEQLREKGCVPKKKEIKGKQVRGWDGIELLIDRPVQNCTANPCSS